MTTKKLITNYTFNPEAGTISSPDLQDIRNLLLITNLSNNKVIYNFAGQGKGGSLVGNTLTLDQQTSGMSADDKLQILYLTEVESDTNGFPYVTLGTSLAGEDTDYDAIHTLGRTAEYIGQTSVSSSEALVAQGLLVAGFSRFVIYVSGTWTGSLTVSSGDGGGVWFNKPVTNDASVNAPATATITTNGVYYADLNANAIRVFASTISAGTVTVTLVATSVPGGRPTIGVQATQSGSWNVGPVIAGSSAVTTVTSDTTTKTLLASNTNRKQAFIYNNSTAKLYVKMGLTASPTSWSFIVDPERSFVLPTPPIYSGAITGFWDSSSGDARITEIT